METIPLEERTTAQLAAHRQFLKTIDQVNRNVSEIVFSFERYQAQRDEQEKEINFDQYLQARKVLEQEELTERMQGINEYLYESSVELDLIKKEINAFKYVFAAANELDVMEPGER